MSDARKLGRFPSSGGLIEAPNRLQDRRRSSSLSGGPTHPPLPRTSPSRALAVRWYPQPWAASHPAHSRCVFEVGC